VLLCVGPGGSPFLGWGVASPVVVAGGGSEWGCCGVVVLVLWVWGGVWGVGFVCGWGVGVFGGPGWFGGGGGGGGGVFWFSVCVGGVGLERLGGCMLVCVCYAVCWWLGCGGGVGWWFVFLDVLLFFGSLVLCGCGVVSVPPNFGSSQHLDVVLCVHCSQVRFPGGLGLGGW